MLGRIAKQLAGQAARQLVANARGQNAASQTPAPRDPETGLLFPQRLEASPTWDRMDASVACQAGKLPAVAGRLGGRFCVAAVGGVGERGATRGAAQLLDLNPRLVISAGLAIATCEQLKRGDVLIADAVESTDGTRLESTSPEVFRRQIEVATSSEQAGAIHVGGLLTTRQLVCSPESRHALAAAHRVLACDTESAWIAQACEARQTPWLAIRVVCDEVQDELPSDIATVRQQSTSAGQLGAAAGSLLRQPGRALDLWNLRQSAAEAAVRLAEVLVQLLK